MKREKNSYLFIKKSRMQFLRKIQKKINIFFFEKKPKKNK